EGIPLALPFHFNTKIGVQPKSRFYSAVPYILGGGCPPSSKLDSPRWIALPQARQGYEESG
ncbi:MAG: hypothetical protein ORO03_02405, partial [Alphaproteobacteria bacterium]|nr:hypothetical protein [Alphaproteobacteria bacterium]